MNPPVIPKIQVEKASSDQRRYEVKCGQDSYVVDVDSRRSRPITLYRRQESVTRPLSKNNATNPQKSKADAAVETIKKLVFQFYMFTICLQRGVFIRSLFFY
uniref:Uncharacterized protein n=1 Tax=Acrobeloides nanus TaxID=290746 RepID=A0A914E5F2_9BILA